MPREFSEIPGTFFIHPGEPGFDDFWSRDERRLAAIHEGDVEVVREALLKMTYEEDFIVRDED